MTGLVLSILAASAGALEVSVPWGGTAQAPAAPPLHAAAAGLPLSDVRDKCRATRLGFSLGGTRVSVGFALDPGADTAAYLIFKPADGQRGAALGITGLTWGGGEVSVLGRRVKAEPFLTLPWQKSRLVFTDEKRRKLLTVDAQDALEEAKACGRVFQLRGEEHFALYGTAFPGSSGPPQQWLMVFRHSKDDRPRRVVSLTPKDRDVDRGYSASLSQSEQLLISR